MTPSELDKALFHAREAALAAWTAIRHFYRGTYSVREKDDGPATEADVLSERTIRLSLQQHYPESDFGYLGEETEEDGRRLACRACWIIDPIDGTNDFIDGLDDFAVHVGLAEVPPGGGPALPVAGVVYQPTLGRLFSARQGGGAWMEDLTGGGRTPIAAGSLSDPALASAVITRSHYGRKMEAALEALRPRTFTQKGSLGIKMTDVARGAFDMYFNTSRGQCKEWDTCAPEIILREAGGILTDLRGNAIPYNQPSVRIPHGLLASNPALHEVSLGIMQRVPELAEVIEP